MHETWQLKIHGQCSRKPLTNQLVEGQQSLVYPKPCNIFQLKPVSNVAHYVPYGNHIAILKIKVKNIHLFDRINIVHKFLIQ